ncbi:MAG: flagellar protein FlaG [Gammaproteobacteria bacterium]|nr:flagellar protein FlaG [Gammaproteobacteria bacterium]
MNTDMNVPILKSITTDLEVQKSDTRPLVEAVDKAEIVALEQKSSDNQENETDISGAELESAVTELNSVAQNLQRDLLFSVDEKSGGTFVKVIDKETDEIVREIPSKEVREIKARLEEVAGLIFRESV